MTDQQYPPNPPGPQSASGQGQPPGHPGYGIPRTNILAVLSLIASLCTPIIGVGFIAGIIMGHIAVRQIQDTGESGMGYAKAGLIIGYIFLAITAIVTVALFIMVLVAATADSQHLINSH